MAVTRTKNTIHMTAANDAVAGQFKILSITYVGTTAGNAITIEDGYAGGGGVLFKGTLSANNETLQISGPVFTSPTGFKVTAMTTGYVTVVHE